MSNMTLLTIITLIDQNIKAGLLDTVSDLGLHNFALEQVAFLIINRTKVVDSDKYKYDDAIKNWQLQCNITDEEVASLKQRFDNNEEIIIHK